MHQQRTYTYRRSGFTLVELLVVILIISILSALLAVVVVRGIGKAKVTRNRVEISQLAAAIDAFKTYYKVEYIPSKIYLSETGTGYGMAGFPADSLAYLQRLWPKLSAPFTSLPGGGIDWNGSGKIEGFVNNATVANPSGEMILEGDQCLVFFLSGIPSQDPVTGSWVGTGFSVNPSNPAAHIFPLPGGGNVKGPLYEFDSSRLVYIPHKVNPVGARMLSYLDTYGASDGKGNLVSGLPYAYFSNYGTRNGYNRYPGGDCPTLGVFPYAQGSTQYVNPTGFQIISAGADLKFGPGTNPGVTPLPLWTPATAANSAASGPNGADDQSNFYDNVLGTPSVN